VKDKKKNRDRQIGTNYYAHNFLPPAVEAKLRTEGKNTAHFVNPKGAMSNYFRPLKFHGDGQVGACGQREWRLGGGRVWSAFRRAELRHLHSRTHTATCPHELPPPPPPLFFLGAPARAEPV